MASIRAGGQTNVRVPQQLAGNKCPMIRYAQAALAFSQIMHRLAILHSVLSQPLAQRLVDFVGTPVDHSALLSRGVQTLPHNSAERSSQCEGLTGVEDRERLCCSDTDPKAHRWSGRCCLAKPTALSQPCCRTESPTVAPAATPTVNQVCSGCDRCACPGAGSGPTNWGFGRIALAALC